MGNCGSFSAPTLNIYIPTPKPDQFKKCYEKMKEDKTVNDYIEKMVPELSKLVSDESQTVDKHLEGLEKNCEEENKKAVERTAYLLSYIDWVK
jgi:hypothetical protein